MRTVLLILIIAVVALIAGISTGYIDISQTRQTKIPSIEADNGAIRAKGGQTPAFDVQTGSVEVGTREAHVTVPKIEVKRDAKSVNVPVVEVRRPQESQQNAAH